MTILISAFDAFDVTLPPIEMITAKVNTQTSRQLVSRDFVLSQPIADPDGTQKTTIRLLPNVASIYYNPINVEYNRVVLSELFAFDSKLLSNDRSTLYQILPYLNAEYGINITQADVYDAPIDFIQPDNTASLGTVAVKAKPDSVLFFGEAVVRVNVTSADGISVNEDDRVYYAVACDTTTWNTDGTAEIYLTSRNVLGAIPSEFNFLGGTQKLISTDWSGVITSYKTKDNNFVIYGEGLALQTGSDLASRRPLKRIEVDATGALVGYSSPALSSYDLYNLCVDEYTGYIYGIANNSSSEPVYFDLEGNYLGSLNAALGEPTGIFTYSMALGVDKTVYVAYGSFDDGTTIKIAALNNEHQPMPDFNTITFSGLYQSNATTIDITGISIIDEYVYVSIVTSGRRWELLINGEPFGFSQMQGDGSAKDKRLLRFNRVTGAPDINFNTVPSTFTTNSQQIYVGISTTAPTIHSLSDTLITVNWYKGSDSVMYALTTKEGIELEKPFISGHSTKAVRYQTSILPVSNTEFLSAGYYYDPNIEESVIVPFAKLVSKTGTVGEEIFNFPRGHQPLNLLMINPDEQQ